MPQRFWFVLHGRPEKGGILRDIGLPEKDGGHIFHYVASRPEKDGAQEFHIAELRCDPSQHHSAVLLN